MLLELVNNEYKAELITTLLTAPVLFVFAELLPKSLFFLRADSLMPSLSPLLYFFHKTFCFSGILYLLNWIIKGMNRLFGISIPSKTLIDTSQRSHIDGIFKEIEEEGLFSNIQRDIVDRLVKIPDVSIGTIMTPIDKVETIDLHSDKEVLLKKLKNCNYTRLLVFDTQPQNIVGWINIYEALAPQLHFTDISSFLKQIKILESETNTLSAIRIMQKENLRILLVVRKSCSGEEFPVGIVTMKDLAEEFLGEITEW
jgi:CBS domain containing-hemolysin-like protein